MVRSDGRRKLKLIRNEVPCGKLPKVRFDGRHFLSSTARNDVGPKVYKLVDCVRPEVFWAIGSISMESPKAKIEMPRDC